MASSSDKVERSKMNTAEKSENVASGDKEGIAAFISNLKIGSAIHMSASKGQVNECRWCEKSADELDEPLRTCSQCHEAKYCSPKCQKSHWKAEHKYTCGKYAMELD